MKCIEDEIPFEVPEGWEWCRLRDIYNFIDYRGATPTKITSGVPLITAKNVKSGYIDYSIDDYISENEYEERQQRGVSHFGDILFTTEAPLGNAALADIDKYSAGQRLITFQHYGASNYLVNNTMLMFILSDFFQNQLNMSKTGSTVAGIKAAILKTLWIPIPPAEEQIRINDKLEQALRLIDNISSNKDNLETNIIQCKAKILNLAIRGQLLPQNPEDEPASVLLERIRAEKEELIKAGKIKRDKKESIIYRGDDNSYYEKFADGEEICIDEEIPFIIPAGWEYCRLENIVQKEIKRGKAPKYSENSNTIVFAQKCNRKTGEIDLSLAQYLDESIINKYPDNEFLKENDIVINSTGTGTLGRVGIINSKDINEYSQVVPDSHVTTLRVSNHIKSMYAYIFLKHLQPYLEGRGEGSTNQKELKPDTLKKLLIPIPPSMEQSNIIEIVKASFDLLEEIEGTLI